MNPSSFAINISAVQSQMDMYKYAGSELVDDEGSTSTINNILFCETKSRL